MAGEAAQLTVEVSGTGNIKAAPPPVLPAIPNVEQFAPTENSTLTFDGPIVHGTKQFQWVIIPQSAGTIEVPAITYSFFDPASRSYRRAATAPILIHARPAVASAGDDAAGAATLSALRTRPERASLRWVRTRAFLFAQLIPVVALVAVVLAQRVRRAPRRSTVLMHDLKRAVSADAPYPTFLRDIEATVRAAVAERCGDPSLRTANIPALEHALRASAVDESLIARLLALIERLETERFAPSAGQAARRDAFAHAAEAVVRELLRAANHTTTVPAAIALFAALQLPAAGWFERGVELHRNGQFNAAARAFESVIAADSQDVAAWSNLGNSYYRAGERGRAVWAWARAARETPRDGDITRNLQAVGAVEVLRTRAPLSVRPVEWYLLAAVGWWIALGVAIAAVLRRRMSLLS
jgi:predicted TPR repeat methyltransferase